MTEAEWKACTDPQKMLEFLGCRASERKLRLFAVASCRRVWHLLTRAEDRRAVELAEGFADGGEGVAVVENFRRGGDWTRPGPAKYAVYPSAAGAAKGSLVCVEDSLVEEGTSAAVKRALREEGETAEEARQAGGRAYTEALHRVRRAERSTHSRLLREVFGNPFRPPPPIDPDWLAWQDRAVDKLAFAAYEERHLPGGHLDLHRLAVLADALEEAGCTDSATLSHLRGPGPHVRGCWVVDLLTGRE